MDTFAFRAQPLARTAMRRGHSLSSARSLSASRGRPRRRSHGGVCARVSLQPRCGAPHSRARRVRERSVRVSPCTSRLFFALGALARSRPRTRGRRGIPTRRAQGQQSIDLHDFRACAARSHGRGEQERKRSCSSYTVVPCNAAVTPILAVISGYDTRRGRCCRNSSRWASVARQPNFRVAVDSRSPNGAPGLDVRLVGPNKCPKRTALGPGAPSNMDDLLQPHLPSENSKFGTRSRSPTSERRRSVVSIENAGEEAVFGTVGSKSDARCPNRASAWAAADALFAV